MGGAVREMLLAAAHADGVGAVRQVTREGAAIEIAARTTIRGLPIGTRSLAVGPAPATARLLAAAGTSELKVWALGSDSHLTVENEAVVAVALLRPGAGDALAVMASRDGEVVLRQLDGTSQWFSAPLPTLVGGQRRGLGDSLQVRAAADRPYTGDGEDHLEFGRYADALALLLENEHTGTPLTMAIDGPWGSGKTSLGRMTQRRLGREQPLATRPTLERRGFPAHHLLVRRVDA